MDLTKLPTSELAASIAEMRKALELRDQFDAHPEQCAAMTKPDGAVVLILTGVPRRPEGMSSAAPPDAPSTPAGRKQSTTPPTQRPGAVTPSPARPSGPQPISVVVQSGADAGMPDIVMEAFWVVEVVDGSNVVRLCHSDGRQLDDGQHRHTLASHENPRDQAE